MVESMMPKNASLTDLIPKALLEGDDQAREELARLSLDRARSWIRASAEYWIDPMLAEEGINVAIARAFKNFDISRASSWWSYLYRAVKFAVIEVLRAETGWLRKCGQHKRNTVSLFAPINEGQLFYDGLVSRGEGCVESQAIAREQLALILEGLTDQEGALVLELVRGASLDEAAAAVELSLKEASEALECALEDLEEREGER